MQSLTIHTFSDILHILEERPEWRKKLVKALFPEVDVQKAFADLAESTRQLQLNLANFQKDVDQRFNSVDQRFAEVKKEQKAMKHDLAIVKGKAQEHEYHYKASGIFGLYLRKGHDVKSDVSDQLYEAMEKGQISEDEIRRALAADLLWGGVLRKSNQNIVLVMEASWRVEVEDVERAAERSDILQRAGIAALPVAGGDEWDDKATKLAQKKQVVTVTYGKPDPAAWEQAIKAHQL